MIQVVYWDWICGLAQAAVVVQLDHSGLARCGGLGPSGGSSLAWQACWWGSSVQLGHLLALLGLYAFLGCALVQLGWFSGYLSGGLSVQLGLCLVCLSLAYLVLIIGYKQYYFGLEHTWTQP